MKPHAALILLILLVPQIFAATPADLVGNWRYDGFIFQDHRYPKPDPRLQVIFTFHPDLTSRLFWKRADESGFCERTGTWKLNSDRLEQTATWINPDNASSCAADPDMQPGRVTENAIALHGEELHLFMLLDGRPFIYILRREPGSK